MIRISKVLSRLLLLVIFFSCQNKNDKQSQSNSTDKKITDTNFNGKPQTFINPYDPVDVSPMDMSYYPKDYPKLKMMDSVSGPPVMRVVYSRPHLQGRKIFDEILKYGEPWRLGANEATEIQFFRDVMIQKKKIPAGRYVLYCIPEEDTWTIILNSNIDTWGLKQDRKKDLFHFEIPVTHNNPSLEYFTLVFEKTNTGADMLMAWDDIVAKLPINF